MIQNIPKNIHFKSRMPKSAKKFTENGSHLEFLIKTCCYHIYNIPIGFLNWQKTEIGAIQFSEDIDCMRPLLAMVNLNIAWNGELWI